VVIPVNGLAVLVEFHFHILSVGYLAELALVKSQEWR
jgi:hypothetical protein